MSDYLNPTTLAKIAMGLPGPVFLAAGSLAKIDNIKEAPAYDQPDSLRLFREIQRCHTLIANLLSRIPEELYDGEVKDFLEANYPIANAIDRLRQCNGGAR